MAKRILAVAITVFALAGAARAQSFSKGFTKSRIAGNNGNATCQVGPDGHLYVGDVNGRLKRYRLKADGAYAGTTDTLVTVSNSRILGIAFDPDATPSNLVLYASVNLQPNSGGSSGSGGEWNGKIVKYTVPPAGSGGSVQSQNKIINLPTGFHDINDIAFGPDKKLYICAGSTTTLGGTGRNSRDIKEKLLSSAILQADVKAISGTLDVRTEQGGNYNPYAAGAKVKLYATGFRNAYDCAWLNGNLYAGINQNDVNGNTGSCNGEPDLNDIKAPEPLTLVRQGKYYGHTNHARGECVHMGGNPTSGTDPWEIKQYPVGTQPLPNFDPSLLHNIVSIGGGSADGSVAYDVPGPLQGRLVVCLFGNNGGGKVMTFTFKSNGRVNSTEPVKDGNGNNVTFTNPLDVALHPNGNLYIAAYGTWDATGTNGAVFLLKPVNPATTTQPTIARSPTGLVASVAQGRNAPNQSFQVWNSGTGTLNYSVSDGSGWLSVSPTSGSSTGPGNKKGHTASFATSGLPAGTYSGTITITSGGASNSPQTIGVSLTVTAPSNSPPVVNAGSNQTVPFPTTVSLDATVTDDGLPNPPGRISVTWTKVSGPGTVSFGNANAVDTTAGFSSAGSYVLRLTADDGGRTGSSEVSISLTTTNNSPPVVTASADRTTLALGGTVNLSGSATDDGLPNPPASLTYQWTVFTGPNVGTVTFGNENSANTTATFSDASTYTLRLTVSDGELTGFDDVTITVTPPAGAKSALFVVANTALNGGDAAVKTRLEGRGYAVVPVAASSATSGSASGMDLVVISSTVSSGSVGTKFRNVAVPVLTWEGWLFDDLGMTGPTVDTDYGLAAGRTQLAIATPSHSMAAGLSGTVTVASSAADFMWGAPNGNALVIATLAGDAGRAAIFGYEAGAAMPGLTAPARRVGLFLMDATPTVLNANGWALFDAAVAWASSTGGGGGMGNGAGLTGAYYDTMDFSGTAFFRTDAAVDFDWGAGSPDSSIAPDTFSIRWTGLLEAQVSETYTFYTRTDDGLRLWVNGQLLIDAWVNQSAAEWSGQIDLVAGQPVEITMEYYENSGDAVAELRWSSASTPKEIIPTSQLFVLDTDGDGTSDAEEIALGTDPNDPNSFPGSGGGTPLGGSGGGSGGGCGATGAEIWFALLLIAGWRRIREVLIVVTKS